MEDDISVIMYFILNMHPCEPAKENTNMLSLKRKGNCYSIEYQNPKERRKDNKWLCCQASKGKKKKREITQQSK